MHLCKHTPWRTCPGAWLIARDQITEDETAFDATWKWASKSNTSVHSFPHIKFGSAHFPVQFQNVSSIHLSGNWSMTPGSSTATSLDTNGLKGLKVISNVAYDIWADVDPEKATSDTKASIEIMIWLTTIGAAAPLGYGGNTTCWKQKLGDNTL